MTTDYLVSLGLYLGSLMIRTGYELLKKAGRVNPKGMMVFAVIFVVSDRRLHLRQQRYVSRRSAFGTEKTGSDLQT